MKTNFFPTKVLEIDLMKSALEDYKKLELLMDDQFEIVYDHFHDKINKALYQIVRNEFKKKFNSTNSEIKKFYNEVFKLAKDQIKDFDISVYEDFYSKNFKFHKTILHYYHFAKSRKIAKMLHELEEKILNTDFEVDEVFKMLDFIRNQFVEMLIRKI